MFDGILKSNNFAKNIKTRINSFSSISSDVRNFLQTIFINNFFEMLSFPKEDMNNEILKKSSKTKTKKTLYLTMSCLTALT